MQRDFLKGLELSDEQINKVMAQYGKDIESLKASTTEETTNLRKINSDLQAKLDTFKDYEELKGFKDKCSEMEGKLNALKVDNLIEKTLLTEKVKNLDIVKKALKLDNVKIDDKGNLEGLAEQIKALKESDSYLFDTEPKITPAKNVNLGNDDHKSDVKDEVVSEFLKRNPKINESDIGEN